MRTLRTCTVMTYTDGTTRRYTVLQGPMSRGGRSFNANKAAPVAAYTVGKGEVANYHAMTAAHATTAAPAVPWQA